jgi:hypothetical protein
MGNINKEFHLNIDGKKFEWPHQMISGKEIKQLGQIHEEYQIFLKISQGDDRLINNDDKVDLSKPGTEQFYSLKIHEHGLRIIVNGRERSWEEKTISYDQVVKLAYENYVESSDVVYTVDYVDGPPKNPEGSMVKGDVVSVKNKMIFNVTATNRS